MMSTKKTVEDKTGVTKTEESKTTAEGYIFTEIAAARFDEEEMQNIKKYPGPACKNFVTCKFYDSILSGTSCLVTGCGKKKGAL